MGKLKTPPLKMKITPDELRSMVVDRSMSDIAIGKELGVCAVSVLHWRQFYGIEQPERARKVYESAAPPPDFFVAEADLRQMYCEWRWSQQKIGDHLNVSQVTVSHWLRKYGIETRNYNSRTLSDLEEAVLREMYCERKMTTEEISRELGLSKSVVRVNLMRCGLQIDAAEVSKRRKERNSGIFDYTTIQQGYRVVMVPGHPRASGRQRYVGEHILVAELELERQVADGEEVHHINLNKLDNTVENLAVLPSKSDHARVHKYMGLVGAFLSTMGAAKPAPLDFGHEVFWGGKYVTSIDLIGQRDEKLREAARLNREIHEIAALDHGAIPDLKETVFIN